MKKYKWLFFDLDNTLMDFDQSEATALSLTFKHFEITENATELAVYHQVNKACWEAFEKGELPQDQLNTLRFQRFLEGVAQKRDAKEVGLYYLSRLVEMGFMVEGAKGMLDQLKLTHQLAIITNGLELVQRPRLTYNNMTAYFKAITVSEEIGVSKPFPAFFEHAFREAENPRKEEVLVIGDSLSSDIQGGVNYGVDTCWFNPKGKTPSAESPKPTYEIANLTRLIELA